MTLVMAIVAGWALLAVLGLAFMAALGRAAARGDAAADPLEGPPEAGGYLSAGRAAARSRSAAGLT